MKASKFDNLDVARKCFEIGLTIKDWSKDKSLRDLHHKIPDYSESEHYQEYLTKVEALAKTDPKSVVPTRETRRTTTLIMHGQDRNIHGKVFGGYLMREAFDISYLTVLCQSDGESPELLRVDQVLFLKPVTVGQIVCFKSKITLIEEIEGIG